MNEAVIARVTPLEAWDLISREPRAILLDVRSKLEFEYVGHAPNAVLVMWKDYPDWRENPHFVDEVRAALARHGGDALDRPILAMCRSGARSYAAAAALARAGYTRLYNVEQGFEGDKDGAGHRSTVGGWRFHGLPWVQS